MISGFEAIRANWGSDVSLERMRTDLEDWYRSFPPAQGMVCNPVSAGGVPAEWVEVASPRPGNRVILYLHGGGFAVGSIPGFRHFASHFAALAFSRVLLLGYRLAPEAVFPAQLEDAIAAYRWLLEQGCEPEEMALAGDSAGAGLILALVGQLQAHKIALPACMVLLTPWGDMRCEGASYDTNRLSDPVANREMAQMMAASYLGPDGKAVDPRATPVLADFSGYPPIYVQAAGRDVFMDDARAIQARARAAGVDSTLDEWPDMIHNWHMYATELDEGKNALGRAAAFIQKHCGG